MTVMKAVSIATAVLLVAIALSFTMPVSHRQCWELECWDTHGKPTPSFCGIIGCEPEHPTAREIREHGMPPRDW
jgi:hypothetical protein